MAAISTFKRGGVNIGIQLKDLPKKIQKYAMGQIENQKPRSKYNNVKTEANGIKFDSIKESQRYTELMLELRGGNIRDLRLQVSYTLQESYITPEGERVRAIKYIADFVYLRKSTDGTWRTVVEDVKSSPTKTAVYKMKKKMMLNKYSIAITEV